MTKVTLLELKENSRVYRCRRCDSDLALYDHIVCKNFKSRNGEAYLFEDAINISAGPVEERLMMTGIHTVTDIFCRGCKECLGWSYIKASEGSEVQGRKSCSRSNQNSWS